VNLVKNDMDLDGIDIGLDLEEFITDPVRVLAGLLRSQLFSLLVGDIDEECFTLNSVKSLGNPIRHFLRRGYARWGALSILHILSPQRLLVGKPYDVINDTHMNGDFGKGSFESIVPDLVDAKRLVFEDVDESSFTMPRALVWSNAINSYVSVMAGWHRPRWKAKLWKDGLEWIDTAELYREFHNGDGPWPNDDKLWPDTVIHVTRENADELQLLADWVRVVRPDMLIEFMSEDDWYNTRHLEDIVRHNNALNPRFGSYVILLGSISINTLTAQEIQHSSDGRDKNSCYSRLDLQNLPDSIHVLSVGYNINALMPVLQALENGLALQRPDINPAMHTIDM
jgi:hypothetical protein